MRFSIVLSTHVAQFQAVAFKGDFESNVAKIAAWGYDGVELAIRDPKLVDSNELIRVVSSFGLEIPSSQRMIDGTETPSCFAVVRLLHPFSSRKPCRRLPSTSILEPPICLPI